MRRPAPLRFSALCLAAAISLLGAIGCAPRQPVVSFLSPRRADPFGLEQIEPLAVCRFVALNARAEPWVDFATEQLIEAVANAFAEQVGPDAPCRIVPAAGAGNKALPLCDALGARRVAAQTGAETVLCAALGLTRGIAEGAAAPGQRARADLNLSVWDARKGRTLLTIAIAEEADLLGPEDEQIRALISRAIHRLVGRTFPARRQVSERLGAGQSDIVPAANKLAAAGRYERALTAYRRALAASPDDDGAAYNAGLMCEALGRLTEARRFYLQALRVRPTSQARRSLRRVSDALNSMGG